MPVAVVVPPAPEPLPPRLTATAVPLVVVLVPDISYLTQKPAPRVLK